MRASVQTAFSKLKRACALLAAAAREIFDEAAYSRYLMRRELAPSREAYAEFSQEIAAAKERRPRCC